MISSEKKLLRFSRISAIIQTLSRKLAEFSAFRLNFTNPDIRQK